MGAQPPGPPGPPARLRWPWEPPLSLSPLLRVENSLICNRHPPPPNLQRENGKYEVCCSGLFPVQPARGRRGRGVCVCGQDGTGSPVQGRGVSVGPAWRDTRAWGSGVRAGRTRLGAATLTAPRCRVQNDVGALASVPGEDQAGWPQRQEAEAGPGRLSGQEFCSPPLVPAAHRPGAFAAVRAGRAPPGQPRVWPLLSLQLGKLRRGPWSGGVLSLCALT